MSFPNPAQGDLRASMPDVKPNNPSFSSGPCPKRPGWSFEAVATRAWTGRSHRASGPKAQIKGVIDKTAVLLELPEGYRVGIVPASDTGAVEMAMWSMLGNNPVDVLVWESFSKGWATDVTAQLKLDDVNILDAPYGELPDLTAIRSEADLIFTWNGTTSGARVPNAEFLNDHQGLVICDATSAVFAQDMDFTKLDVVTFSWQKVMGGEGAHGVIILSPKAVARLESYAPDRPLPKIFRMTKGGKLIEGIFTGATINTPSMLAIADADDALDWIKSLGGLKEMQKRADTNFAALQDWVNETPWIENLVSDPTLRSNTSVCLSIVDPRITALDVKAQRALIKDMTALLDSENAAFDIGGYRDAPPGLRIWCGATVETNDIDALTPWLDYAFAAVTANL